MEGKKRLGKNALQNLAIILLSVSAIALFAQTQIVNLGTGTESYLRGLLSSSAPTAPETATSLTEVPVSVRIAVTGAYGRYGDAGLTTTDESFAEVGTLLREALGSAGTVASCDKEEFRKALKETSVYFDFGTDLPLNVLAGLVGTTVTGEQMSARRLLLADGSAGIMLYLQNESGGCFRCNTKVTRSDLAGLIQEYQLGNASFAYELGDAFAEMEPYTLLIGDLPELKTLSAADSLTDTDELLTQLQFNPHTKSRYTDSDGAEVVVEGDRTLKIRPDGTVLCQNGSDDTMTISTGPEEPDQEETVVAAYRLMASLLSGRTGDAVLVLQGVRTAGVSTVLQFGYLVDGVPVRFSDGDPAAEITLTDAHVTSLSLRCRAYSATLEDALLLPLPQACAIAQSKPGAELTENYVDDGRESVTACWLAD